MSERRWEGPEALARHLAALGLSVRRPELFVIAFTHASYVHDAGVKAEEDNERLEFLGDAVLELVVSDYLYRKVPPLTEGEMTKRRAMIVCEASLATFARALGFPPLIRLGRGEDISGGRDRPSLLADVFEAFVGALYLDQGLDGVVRFFEHHLVPRIENGEIEAHLDYKSTLQEWLQQKGTVHIQYEVVTERGPAHDREFVSRVVIEGEAFGEGVGRSKKEAEQKAALEALRRLGVLV
ncbi:ribonuclease III [Hydrogenibacillus sp. N12]|uniref:ribonuclease III n=1 Tax=Hydrogenibacillus sp. N12 TaxID=2866627 RepID=UPI00207BD809|nr:ribonuclease III [Hydrogenibacillus sp. N12]